MRLIDADVLKYDMQKYFDGVPVYMPGVFHTIERAPTIEAEPVRHGHWIIRGGDMWCSECRYEDVTENGEPENYHYCPNCGVKMDGGDGNG